ncbi:hypothetical protein [Hydrogenophaga sp. 5NK40-0174]|uniref:hypothetical protein n=1 Tax=Hydrogenophaga sp. 5NK40-0174 TaxID=3127649 RepID=UPI00333E6A03
MTHEETCRIKVVMKQLQGQANWSDARLDLFESAETYRIDMHWENQLLFANADDWFQALQAIREQLEPQSAFLCCQGARLNVYPSGMSRDMGGGRMAYVLVMEEHAQPARLVDIFDPADDSDFSTVAEQNAFFARWLKSEHPSNTEAGFSGNGQL